MGSHKITIMQVKVLLLCFLCSLAMGEKINPGKERAGGLLGFGILGGDSADATTAVPADTTASDATTATNEGLAEPQKSLDRSSYWCHRQVAHLRHRCSDGHQHRPHPQPLLRPSRVCDAPPDNPHHHGCCHPEYSSHGPGSGSSGRESSHHTPTN